MERLRTVLWGAADDTEHSVGAWRGSRLLVSEAAATVGGSADSSCPAIRGNLGRHGCVLQREGMRTMGFPSFKALSDVLSQLGHWWSALSSLRDANFLVPPATHGRMSEDAFGGQLRPNAKQRLSGVLSPYVLSTAQLAYRALIARTSPETITNRVYFPHRGVIENTATVTLTRIALSVPAIRLPDVVVGSGPAQVWWLYPPSCRGLKLTEKPGSAVQNTPVDVFDITEDHRPIPCLLRPTVQYDSFLANEVEVVGHVVTPSLETVAPLLSVLDRFQTNVLSNCVRPFGNVTSLLALDLRESSAEIRLVRTHDSFPMVVTAQGAVTIRDLTKDEANAFFAAVLDAVPDRAGRGPARAVSYGESDVVSVISEGDLRWVFDQERGTMGVYAEVDLKDHSAVNRTVAAMVSHWQSWQTNARRKVKAGIGAEPKINPILVWEPSILSRFHPGGFVLDPKVEAQLSSADPAVRQGIDWLRVAAGR